MSDIQAFGIIVGIFISGLGLLLNAIALFKGIASRKISNYQEIIKSHREIWKITLDKPEMFKRLFDVNVNLDAEPITQAESRFIRFVLFHMTSVYNFTKGGDLSEIEKMKLDIDNFLSFPIPKMVWKNTKKFFNDDFCYFVDSVNPSLIESDIED